MSIVYHYCSMETFQKIIENRTLRFSDITKSNDSQEIIWIVNFIVSALTKEYEKQSEEFKGKCPLEKVIKRQTTLFVNRYWGEYSPYTYFVSCFSDEKNSLNMWERYADNGKGVAIGFNDLYLENLVGTSDCFQYGTVDYVDISNTSILSKETAQLFEKLNEVVNKGENINYNNPIYDKYVKNIFLKAVFCKHPCFEDEKEKRACVHWNLNFSNPTSLTYKGLKIAEAELGKDLKNGKIKLYIDMHFYPEKFSKALSTIIIGPKCEWNIKDVRTFLHLSGLNKTPFYNIDYSNIPLA